MRAATPALALAVTLAAGPAQAVELLPPLACPEGVDCFIQSLVDRDPGPGAADFICGTLTYDGHQGTDFRVPAFADLDRGVDILAAARGKVRAVRDGEPDTGLKGAAQGKECGNGVVIDHGDGWSTQYCHLAKGSIAVAAGEEVEAGAVLGRMGYSGNTEFPHLHLVVRRGDVVVDPFDGQAASDDCSAPDDGGLWASAPEVRFGGLIDGGFAGAPPTTESIRQGLPEQGFDPTDDKLLFWARSFGHRPGDVLAYRLTGPTGETLAEYEHTLEKPRAIQFRYVGLRRPEGGWTPGAYAGEVAMRRWGRVLEEKRFEMTLP